MVSVAEFPMDFSTVVDRAGKTATDERLDTVIRSRLLSLLHLRLPLFDHVDDVLLALVRDWPDIFTADPTIRTDGCLTGYDGDRNENSDRLDPTGKLREAEDTIAGLRQALESNRVIATACGIVMARRNLTQPQAFDLLRLESQRTNRKLLHLAEHIVDTGLAPQQAAGAWT